MNPILLISRYYHHLKGLRGKAGQSLVETAIALPVFIIMLLGVFEVGWALRSYLVLANVNREATRFAARGVYLDLKQKNDPEAVGYDKVISHTLRTLSQQLAMDFLSSVPNASMAIQYYNAEPASFACPGDPDCSDYDCSKFNLNSASFVEGTDLTLVEYPLLLPPDPVNTSPSLPNWYKSSNRVLTLANTKAITAYYYYRGPIDRVEALSRINPADKVRELRAELNQHNCELLKKKLPPTSNNMIVIENIFYQDQLVGLPFVTYFFPNPVPLYTHTAMRVQTNIRSTDEETTAECGLYPIMVPLSKVSGIPQGATTILPFANDSTPSPGNFGWVEWNGYENNATVNTVDNLQHPGNASTNYREPAATDGQPIDDKIDQTYDWISGNPGQSASSQVRTQLESLRTSGKLLMFPVWNDMACPGSLCSTWAIDGSGNNGRYRVNTFVAMRLTGIYETGNNAECGGGKCLIFEFDHLEGGYCQPGNGH